MSDAHPDDLRILFVTIPPADAQRVVGTLVEERLIACGNVMPGARSCFRWEGKVCHEEEAVLFMETTVQRLPAATQRLRALHPYSVPKIIALRPDSVNADYAAWAVRETTPEG